jgi:hypothetical protein
MLDEPKDHLSSFLKRRDKTEISNFEKTRQDRNLRLSCLYNKRQNKTEISACPVFKRQDRTKKAQKDRRQGYFTTTLFQK